MFFPFSNRLGCAGSMLLSLAVTAVLLLIGAQNVILLTRDLGTASSTPHLSTSVRLIEAPREEPT